MDCPAIDQLRYEVEKTYGRRILSSADCQQICLDIQQKTRLRISFNTLRRFFNLMKDMHLPSNYTCEVLSQYCGFSSFQDFQKFRSTAGEDKKSTDSGLLDFLVLMFQNTQVSGTTDITYFSLVKQTICYLERYPELIDEFQRAISKTANGQNYYFEQFIHIDRLSGYYGKGLRYYISEKKTVDAQITGHFLLCFKSWMTRDREACIKHAQIIGGYSIAKGAVSLTTCGRFFASQLLLHELMDMDPGKIILDARQMYLQQASSTHPVLTYQCFELILAEALLLTGQHEEALFYLDELQEKTKRAIPSFMDHALAETIYLFQAFAYVQEGNKTKAREIFEKVNPSRFYFLMKKYLTVIYLTVSKNMRQKHVEQEQVRQMVKETGFTRLGLFWEKTDVLQLA